LSLSGVRKTECWERITEPKSEAPRRSEPNEAQVEKVDKPGLKGPGIFFAFYLRSLHRHVSALHEIV
jgi:hypothetical protein